MRFAGIMNAFAARRSTDGASSLMSALSGQAGQGPTAAQPLEYAAAHADKERRPPGMASPARSDRQRLIPAWKPMEEARSSSRSTGPTGPSPRLGGTYLTCAVCTDLPPPATKDLHQYSLDQVVHRVGNALTW